MVTDEAVEKKARVKSTNAEEEEEDESSSSESEESSESESSEEEGKTAQELARDKALQRIRVNYCLVFQSVAR